MLKIFNMSKIYKVVSQTECSQKDDGDKKAVSTIVLQAFGGEHEDTFACTLWGNLAQGRFYGGELVVAKLRFQHKERDGRIYQDVTVRNIEKLK